MIVNGAQLVAVVVIPSLIAQADVVLNVVAFRRLLRKINILDQQLDRTGRCTVSESDIDNRSRVLPTSQSCHPSK